MCYLTDRFLLSKYWIEEMIVLFPSFDLAGPMARHTLCFRFQNLKEASIGVNGVFKLHGRHIRQD
jgi:hypothetical protein